MNIYSRKNWKCSCNFCMNAPVVLVQDLKQTLDIIAGASPKEQQDMIAELYQELDQHCVKKDY